MSNPSQQIVQRRWDFPWVLPLPLLLTACVTGTFQVTGSGWTGRGHGVPSYYAQSCATNMLACTPVGASGEIIAPTVTGGVVRAVEAMEALMTLKDFLDAADVARVEEVLVKCAKEADSKINKQEYGEGKYPDDAECDRVVGYTDNKSPITRAIDLGNMKHAAAFECVQREIGNEFPDHISREPRYGNKSSAEGPVLTNRKPGSLVPDIVLHLTKKPNKVRFVYDFYFPCKLASKSDPRGKGGMTLSEKQEKYAPLGGDKEPALVTPQLGISR
ncbi:hypothetical protein [Archangium sp.]|uniref:hypothetical protein n=1 Tax=Archangium sp. TaxID=1872627 RepID=UPI00286C4AEE|nr:hypothetical protein [Archangium sp.]